MFDLENLDLDFDDDFSTNIFGKNIQSATINPDTGQRRSNNLELSIRKKPEPLKRQIEENEQLFSKVQNKKLKNDTSPGTHLNNVLRDESNFNFPNCVQKLKRQSSTEEKPSKRKFTHEGLIQRKFPGPAGLLPDKPFREIKNLSEVDSKTYDEECNEEEKEKPVIYSQSSGSMFLDSSYQRLISDFELNEARNPLSRHTIEWVKKTAMNKSLNGRKIPFLALVLHSVNHNTPDPVLLLRDPSGEIHGTLHREVWADLGDKLQIGIALALRQIGVLITGVVRRQIYLNITMNNILAIYTPSANGVEITTVNKISKSDLMQNIQSWKSQAPSNPPPTSSPTVTCSLFSTIPDSKSRDVFPTRPPNEEIKNLKNKLQSYVDNSVAKNSKSREKQEENSDNILANLGIAFTDCDFTEDLIIPQDEKDKMDKVGQDKPTGRSKPEGKFQVATSSQALTKAETLMFEEVLSGIDLNEFEM